VGIVRRLLGPLHVTGVFWYWLPSQAVRVLPLALFDLVVLSFTSFFFVFLFRIRKAIAANLEAVLGPCGFLERQRRIWRTMVGFAWCYFERYERLEWPERFSAQVEGPEGWQALLGGERGIIFVTAHVGHWESMSYLGGGPAHRPVHVVREEEMNPVAHRFFERLLKRKPGSVSYTTHFATGDPRVALRLAEALQRGEIVALQGDRPRGGHGRAQSASLFGLPMLLPPGPAALARIAKVPLVPVFGFREGRHRYRVVLREPIGVSNELPRDAAVASATLRLAEDIEWAIRQRPHQWFCFHRLWS
jgi:KDO2-lipid IV(A) lauroyltransferase